MNDTLVTLNRNYKRTSKFNTPNFIVAHYAGDVQYEIKDFIEKNADLISELITDSLGGSKQSLLEELFKKAPTAANQMRRRVSRIRMETVSQ
mmetsp:Transcript_118787/g.165520  ORF Transcript_118787/g.165520 Transcript_118787/m.165520 type:complete len:92 (+) Transcript_118787:217-492(+)